MGLGDGLSVKPFVVSRAWGGLGCHPHPSLTLAPQPRAAPCASEGTHTAPRPAAAAPAPACPSARARACLRPRGPRRAWLWRSPRRAGSCGGHVGTGPEPSDDGVRTSEGRMLPPPLPFLAGALARAELAGPGARWPKRSQLCRAPLQQLLPAPRPTPLQLSQLLLMPPLQLHDALQLPQLFQAGGSRLCGNPGEAPRCPGAPRGSRTLPRLVPQTTLTQQAVPAAFFVASSLAPAQTAARGTGRADRCPGVP